LESETVISKKTDVSLMKAHHLTMSFDIPRPYSSSRRLGSDIIAILNKKIFRSFKTD
jgi:hypothetical protein